MVFKKPANQRIAPIKVLNYGIVSSINMSILTKAPDKPYDFYFPCDDLARPLQAFANELV